MLLSTLLPSAASSPKHRGKVWTILFLPQISAQLQIVRGWARIQGWSRSKISLIPSMHHRDGALVCQGLVTVKEWPGGSGIQEHHKLSGNAPHIFSTAPALLPDTKQSIFYFTIHPTINYQNMLAVETRRQETWLKGCPMILRRRDCG